MRNFGACKNEIKNDRDNNKQLKSIINLNKGQIIILYTTRDLGNFHCETGNIFHGTMRLLSTVMCNLLKSTRLLIFCIIKRYVTRFILMFGH